MINTVKGLTADDAIRQFVTQYVQKCPSLTGGRFLNRERNFRITRGIDRRKVEAQLITNPIASAT
jgi:hypothetical protein